MAGELKASYEVLTEGRPFKLTYQFMKRMNESNTCTIGTTAVTSAD